MGQLHVVADAQFGSTGKGAFAKQLMRQYSHAPWSAVRVAGPNAGHTVYDDSGQPWAFRAVPVAAVVDRTCALYVAAGSEVELQVLMAEIAACEAAGFPVRARLMVDRQATLLTGEHKQAEGGNDGPLQNRIGSTGKGIGAARAERIWRKAPLVRDVEHVLNDQGIGVGDTPKHVAHDLQGGRSVMIEGTQGYGLGLHAGYYPFCTSSDCRALDFLGMAGISPWADYVDLRVWLTARTFPIRVAGNSGPLANEIDWDTLAYETHGYVKPERTTVTKKIRRVGRWDGDLVRRAVLANGGPSERVRLALMFADYIAPKLAGATDPQELIGSGFFDFVDRVEEESGSQVAFVGTGPDSGIWFEKPV